MLSLRDVLSQWLEHRIEVLVRRSQFRLKKIEHRLEVLEGYLIAYLNIDEVIRIVRFEEQLKAALISTFSLTEVQADAILNLRLKSLSRLEEIEIKAEHDKLSRERRQLKALLKSDELQWERVAEEVRETRERYSKKTALGRRRSEFADAPTSRSISSRRWSRRSRSPSSCRRRAGSARSRGTWTTSPSSSSSRAIA